MASILNPVSAAALAGAAAEGGGPQIRSEGQKLLDRQLEVRNRLLGLHKRFRAVRVSIQTLSDYSEPQIGNPAAATQTAFFDGMSLLTDEFEAVATALEACVKDLETLF